MPIAPLPPPFSLHRTERGGTMLAGHPHKRLFPGTRAAIFNSGPAFRGVVRARIVDPGGVAVWHEDTSQAVPAQFFVGKDFGDGHFTS